ncbi:carbonic anhydrase [Sphingomonas sp. 28-63-12]|uniref:carbonic anhydrase n=1 Tax=Sphingomonas sp. 28-63-12 TaxID=1970434 RepID=UPI000BDD8227|nr:MAG: carbonic anhydrase [Sphingomonas sp. 28-63-12]
MKHYKQLLLANKAWANELTDENPEFFTRQIAGQRPDFLWIGCSDSRVSPEQMTMTPPGGMFIHRNVANLVNSDDLNLMSVLQYATEVLKVRHIIVCGHYGCGGLQAALAGHNHGPVKAWLQNADAVLEAHQEEVLGQPSVEEQVNRLVEVNVRDQLVQLARTDLIQAAWARGQEIFLHGWVYDIRDGHIKPLMEIEAGMPLDDVGQPDKVLHASIGGTA